MNALPVTGPNQFLFLAYVDAVLLASGVLVLCIGPIRKRAT